MLPKKVIVAAVIASLLLFGYEGLSEQRTEKAPNLLLGFAIVGAYNAYRSLKDWVPSL